MVVPLKWLPWIMLIGGIIMIFSGEGDAWSVFVTIAGGVWLYVQFSNKGSLPKANEETLPQPPPDKDAASVIPEHSTCPSCGNQLTSGVLFCDQCGTKV